ncbi:MAG: hypothetical protein BWY73_00168 [candidate division TA06 bacterium ADurb.Bin417]|uniref:Uncharacterized protein n=1 Tax=candidate division TA06 bacterium ADurb.Bin417 TaxID=1852828 RepID=A0A1V5ML74_UNCT6|nr:MAG: hypothetical protein BWY73_00168 [candidate division TA06 bacterium ADurb.Bin417]
MGIFEPQRPLVVAEGKYLVEDRLEAAVLAAFIRGDTLLEKSSVRIKLRFQKVRDVRFGQPVFPAV